MKDILSHPNWQKLLPLMLLFFICTCSQSTEQIELDLTFSPIGATIADTRIMGEKVTIIPTETILPTYTPNPTQTSTPTLVPTIWTNIELDVANVSNMTQITNWGLGRIDSLKVIKNSEITVIKTPIGIYLYRTSDNFLIKNIEGGYIFSISPDETIIATGHKDGLIRIWDSTTGDLLHEFSHEMVINQIYKDTVEPSKWHFEFPSIQEVSAIAFFPEGGKIAAGYIDGTVEVWDVISNEQIAHLKSDIITAAPSGILVSPNQENLFVISGGRITFWNTSNWTLYNYLNDAGSFCSGSFTKDENILHTVNSQFVKLWNIKTGEKIHQFSTGLSVIDSIEISEDGKEAIIYGNWGTTKQVRKYPEGNLVSQEFLPREQIDNKSSFPYLELGHYPGLLGLEIISTNEFRIYGNEHGQIFWLDFPERILSYSTAIENVTTNYHPIDQSLSWCQDGIVQIQSLNKQIDKYTVPSQTRCEGVILSPNRNYAAVFGQNFLSLLNLTDGSVQDFIGLQKEINTVIFSPDETVMASGSISETWGVSEVAFWQTDPPKSLSFPEKLENSTILGLEISHDGSFAISIGGHIRKYIVDTGYTLFTINSYSETVSISPDDTLIASSGEDGIIYIWNATDGNELVKLEGNKDKIVDLEFTPDGTGLLTVSLDGIIRLWGIP